MIYTGQWLLHAFCQEIQWPQSLPEVRPKPTWNRRASTNDRRQWRKHGIRGMDGAVILQLRVEYTYYIHIYIYVITCNSIYIYICIYVYIYIYMYTPNYMIFHESSFMNWRPSVHMWQFAQVFIMAHVVTCRFVHSRVWSWTIIQKRKVMEKNNMVIYASNIRT